MIVKDSDRNGNFSDLLTICIIATEIPSYVSLFLAESFKTCLIWSNLAREIILRFSA